MLTVVKDTDPSEFLKHSGALLYTDEPANSLMIGLCENLVKSKAVPTYPPQFWRVVRDGKTVTSAMQTRPINLVVTFGKAEEIEILAQHLHSEKAYFEGVVGPAKESELFANIWSTVSGRSAKLGMGQKIYRLDKVNIPDVEGSIRQADLSDTDLVTQWLVEFGFESLPANERENFEQRKPLAIWQIERGNTFFWMVDGKPVSMAMVARPTLNGITVNAVYTPKDRRKKGYASAVVAHLSQKKLDEGRKFCVLYTDLANPTSNKIYQNVGYVEWCDSKHFLFE